MIKNAGMEVYDQFELAHPEIELAQKNLSELIDESNIGGPENEEMRNKLLEGCRYVGTAAEFFHMLSAGASTLVPNVKDSMVLGLQGYGHGYGPERVKVYEPLLGATGAKGFRHIDILVSASSNDPEAKSKNPEKFLPEAIDKVGGVVFFVPPKNKNFSHSSITRRELTWFYKNPKALEKLYLIFGAYELINPEVIQQAMHLEKTLRPNIPDRRIAKFYEGDLAVNILKNLAETIAIKSNEENQIEHIIHQSPDVMSYPTLSELSDNNAAQKQVKFLDAITLLTKYYTEIYSENIFGEAYITMLKDTINPENGSVSRELLIKIQQLKTILQNASQFELEEPISVLEQKWQELTKIST